MFDDLRGGGGGIRGRKHGWPFFLQDEDTIRFGRFSEISSRLPKADETRRVEGKLPKEALLWRRRNFELYPPSPTPPAF